MKIMHYTDIDAIGSDELGLTGAKDLSIRFLISQGDGAPHFSMMLLELAPEGNTPEHSHQWEEEIFVRSGGGEIKSEDTRTSIRKGDALYIAPNETHQFLNTGSEKLELLCMIPHQSE
jgi:quercetin dioxygenase-like cupin family protein